MLESRWKRRNPFLVLRAVYFYNFLWIRCITHRDSLFFVPNNITWMVSDRLIEVDWFKYAIDLYNRLVEDWSLRRCLVFGVSCFGSKTGMLRNSQKEAFLVLVYCLIASRDGLIVGVFRDGTERHLVDNGLHLRVPRIFIAGWIELWLSGGDGVVIGLLWLFWMFGCWSGTGAH